MNNKKSYFEHEEQFDTVWEYCDQEKRKSNCKMKILICVSVFPLCLKHSGLLKQMKRVKIYKIR